MAKIESGGGQKVADNAGGQDVKVSPSADEVKAFDKFDVNNDGKLTRAEYKQAAIDDEVSFDRAADLVSKQGHTVDLSDFAKARRIAARQTQQQPAKAAGEGVGKFSASQVREEVSQRTPGFIKATKKEFAALDKDKSGDLSRPEYAKSPFAKKISFDDAKKIATKGGNVNASDFLGAATMAPKMSVPKTALASAPAGQDSALMNAANKWVDTPPGELGVYPEQGFAERKANFGDMVSGMGASEKEQSWLLAHASLESPKLGGNAGEGKKYGRYGAEHPTNPNGVKQGDDREFGIYNIGYGVLRDFGVDAAKKQGLIPANADPAQVVSKIENDLNDKEGQELSSKVMVGMLREYGFDRAEALIRGGQTGLEDYNAGFKNGDTYGVQKWNTFVADLTRGYSERQDLATGDARHSMPHPHC